METKVPQVVYDLKMPPYRYQSDNAVFLSRNAWLFPAAFSLSVAGCATMPKPDVATRVETVEVRIPVPVACVDKSVVPALPGKVGSQLTGDAPHDLDVVSAALIRMRAIADQAISMLGACAK